MNVIRRVKIETSRRKSHRQDVNEISLTKSKCRSSQNVRTTFGRSCWCHETVLDGVFMVLDSLELVVKVFGYVKVGRLLWRCVFLDRLPVIDFEFYFRFFSKLPNVIKYVQNAKWVSELEYSRKYIEVDVSRNSLNTIVS